MTELVVKLDFLKSVTPHLHDDSKQNLSIKELDPKVVGQERNAILYTWFCRQENRPTKWKTLISVYDTTRHASKILFTHNDKIDVVSASVSQTFILLAFTVRERHTSDSQSPTEIFKSYLAEIAPQKRVFSLNIEWHTYQKVQFLYQQQPSLKEIYMLFIHHKESIGLYRIPLAKLGDDGFVMSSQPKTDQIIRQFLWSQFDPIERRLFFIQLKAQDEEEDEGVVIFNAIQFDDRGKHRYILNFQLPVSFNVELMKEPVSYFDTYLGQTVSNMNLNITTLTSSKGAMMVCYQHPVDDSDRGSKFPESSEADRLSVSSTMQDTEKITYSVFCIHGGYTLTCSVSFVPTTVSSNRILFTMFGDYLMVLLYGCFLHLLDCGSEHEPIHHILLGEDGCTAVPEFAQNGCLLSSAVWDYMPALHHGVLLYDSVSQKSFKMAFNHKSLIKIFSTTRHASTRMAILHSAIVHIKDSMFSKKLIECLCQDPSNIECSELLKEYLIACSYARMKQQLSYFLLKPLPFTSFDPFRGQVERDREKKKTVFLSYKKFSKNLIDALLYLLKGIEREYWSYLQKNIQLSQDPNLARFPVKSLAYSYVDIDKELKAAVRDAGAKPHAGKLRIGTEDVAQISRSSAKEKGAQLRDDYISKLITEKFSAHILKCFPRENKTRVHNICVEYALCRGKVVKSLWKHLTKVLGYNQEYDVYGESLTKKPSATGYALFQMLERIHLCLTQLCFPEFRDMQNVLSALAYRCLPSHLFLQYLHASVFTVSPDFVTRFVSEVPDEDNIGIKIELVSGLPRSHTKAVLSKWKHPVAKRFLVNELLGKFDGPSKLNEIDAPATADSMEAGANDQDVTGLDRFLPFETFLKAIRSEANSKAFESHKLTAEETELLKSLSLRE